MAICPIHGNADMVQNLPALVLAENYDATAIGSYSRATYSNRSSAYTLGPSTHYGTMTSVIGQKLAAPPSPFLLDFGGFVFWSFLFYISICIIIGPYFVWKSYKKTIVENPYYQDKLFGNGKGSSHIFILIFGWVPIFWFFIPRYLKRIREESEFDFRYDLWTETVKKWESLYYCHKCGYVIDPKTSTIFRPDNLYSYLKVDSYK